MSWLHIDLLLLIILILDHQLLHGPLPHVAAQDAVGDCQAKEDAKTDPLCIVDAPTSSKVKLEVTVVEISAASVTALATVVQDAITALNRLVGEGRGA